uniref:OTU domain-containing protein n=1 Tax=Strigamia maritima TaxID=126957 RepID=T1J9E1_STRMM
MELQYNLCGPDTLGAQNSVRSGQMSGRHRYFSMAGDWLGSAIVSGLGRCPVGSVRTAQSKYFGPEEITITTNDEVTSPVSDVDSSCSLPLDSPNDQEESEETTSDLSDFELPDMGNSLTRYEPVAFNSQCGGISFSDLSLGTSRLPTPAVTRPRSKLSFICSKLGNKRRKTSGVFANLGSLISKTSSSQLELTPLQNGAGEALADDDINITDWTDAMHRQFSDGEADIESLGSPSMCMYEDSESEENNDNMYINSDRASLHANFSPGSLLGRHHFLDRVPPDGADQHPKDADASDDFSINEEDISETLKKPLAFPEDNSFLETTDSEETASNIARRKRKACLTRDQSFDSTGSDVSVEVSFCEDIGVSTMATFDRLLASVDQVKQSCLNLDENIDHLKGNPFYKMDTLKSPMSECSDVSGGHSAIDFVRKYKSRASFRGLLDTGVAHTVFSDSTTNTDSSSGLPNLSGQLSLQWDDSSFVSNDNSVLNKNIHGHVMADRTADSGSDFGASLTSESPEPNKCLLTSPISLEWEEEFLNQTSPTMSRKAPNFNQQIPEVFSTSLSERIVPGQSRDCSPGDSGPANLLKLKDQSCSNNREDKWCQWTCSESGFVDDNQVEIVAVHRRSKSPSSTTRKANRDSAFCEGLDIGFSRMQENIGEKWDLIQYSETEWRGHTTRAETIRKGYAHIPSTLNCLHLRRIRGDNYCAIRAALFQVLQLGLPFVDSFDGCTSVCEKLENWANNKYSWLKEWSFGSRLPYSNSTCIQGFKTCIASLDRLSTSIQNNANREEILVDQFNSNPDMDVQLMEAVKLLMFIRSAELYEQSLSGCDVPIFAILMFARETSETPKHFMENHLNLVGDSAGLEQVEMYLLGDTLRATLRVLRPSSFGREDYICYYPEKSNDSCPEVNLIAEDDRHYNIILT